jgi:flagellar hook assembly protein FlgD
VEYSATAAPGKDNYDNVYAYPNPVKPDYTGWITVTGLMDNSLVKITDAAANVVTQGTSDGGMFVWDGCNRNGERVKSGVYYVFASQNATGSNTACVTKIMVIN